MYMIGQAEKHLCLTFFAMKNCKCYSHRLPSGKKKEIMSN